MRPYAAALAGIVIFGTSAPSIAQSANCERDALKSDYEEVRNDVMLKTFFLTTLSKDDYENARTKAGATFFVYGTPVNLQYDDDRARAQQVRETLLEKNQLNATSSRITSRLSDNAVKAYRECLAARKAPLVLHTGRVQPKFATIHGMWSPRTAEFAAYRSMSVEIDPKNAGSLSHRLPARYEQNDWFSFSVERPDPSAGLNVRLVFRFNTGQVQSVEAYVPPHEELEIKTEQQDRELPVRSLRETLGLSGTEWLETLVATGSWRIVHESRASRTIHLSGNGRNDSHVGKPTAPEGDPLTPQLAYYTLRLAYGTNPQIPALDVQAIWKERRYALWKNGVHWKYLD